MSSDGPDLGALLTQVALGDHDAFSVVYRLTWRRVLATVQRKLIDPAQSEEVAQEVFIEVWQLADRFSTSRGSALGWMLTIATRRAIDRVRAAQASRDRDRVAAGHEFGHDHVLEDAIASVERDELFTALRQIKPLQREALIVTYLNGHSIAEAAVFVGASESAVKTRMRNGIIELRQVLAETTLAA